MLTTGPQGGGGGSNALGGFSDVFEPARARADDDLKSKENQIEVTPVPEDDDRPMVIDTRPDDGDRQEAATRASRTACAAAAARWSLSTPADASCR